MKLSNNLTIEQRMNTEWGYHFDPMQCAEILDGAQRGINAELYANPDYDNIVMREIKEVLLKNPSLEERSLKEYLDAYIKNYDFSHCKTTTEFMKTYHEHAKHAYENDEWFRYYREMQERRRCFR